MSALSTLFEQFLRERRYLKNVTPKTVTWYQTAFDALTRTVGAPDPVQLGKPVLQDFVVRLRERGLSPVSCNTYVICNQTTKLVWWRVGTMAGGPTRQQRRYPERQEQKANSAEPFLWWHWVGVGFAAGAAMIAAGGQMPPWPSMFVWLFAWALVVFGVHRAVQRRSRMTRLISTIALAILALWISFSFWQSRTPNAELARDADSKASA